VEKPRRLHCAHSSTRVPTVPSLGPHDEPFGRRERWLKPYCLGPRHITLIMRELQFENCPNTAMTRDRGVAAKEVKAPWKRPARNQGRGSANRGANSRTRRRTRYRSCLARLWP